MTDDDDLIGRLRQLGAGSLTPMELLALLIGEDGEVLERSRRVVRSVGGIRRLADLAPADLEEAEVDAEAAARVLAALELGRRVLGAARGDLPPMPDPAAVARHLAHLRDEKREHFCALYLDTKGSVVRTRTISIGALDATVVHPREVFREAIREGACSVIVAHNHPSGDPTPSSEDIEITRRLKEAGDIVGIELLDHVILGDNSHESLKQRGVI